MNKCFITKLPSSVDNDNLPVLGQLRINWLKQNDLTDSINQRFIGLATNDSITVKVSGAHFTDKTLASNLGNTKTITAADGTVSLWVSNDADAVLTIDNKYSLTIISFFYDNFDSIHSSYFDIEDIKYCTNLTGINLTNSQVSGDISALSNLTNLTGIKLTNSQVSGDISALSQLTALTNIELMNTQVSGDISALSQLTALSTLLLSNTQVSGDISALSQLTALSTLLLSNTQVSGDISALSQLTALTNITLNNTQVSGKIDSLANLTKMLEFTNLKGLSLTGDMSKIPINIKFISQLGRKVNTNFTWTANGRKNGTLLAMDGRIPFDTASMDNMLIDQATCTFKPNTSMPLYNVIAVSGTRTSASDAAVTTLQSKGVTITGVTKAS